MQGQQRPVSTDITYDHSLLAHHSLQPFCLSPFLSLSLRLVIGLHKFPRRTISPGEAPFRRGDS